MRSLENWSVESVVKMLVGPALKDLADTGLEDSDWGEIYGGFPDDESDYPFKQELAGA